MRTIIQKTDLEAAIRAINEVKISKTGETPSEFTGYIASFGAAVVQSGLLPAVIFFEDKGGASQDRPKLMSAIRQMLGITQPKLSDYLLMPETDLIAARNDVLRMAIALKLALRTFKKSTKS